jgi:hypothetical protein
MLVGLILGVLLGLNVAVPLHARSLDPACRRNRFAGTFGALPGLLLGFSCCAPTLILLLGTNAAAAILPVFIPLRELLFPLAVGLMTVMLVWTARARPDRARDRHGDADERAAVPARRPQARASSF